jgi:hypothetical protein
VSVPGVTLSLSGSAAVFVAIDHFTAECVGIHAARQATRFEALDRSARACGRISAASPRTSHAA